MIKMKSYLKKIISSAMALITSFSLFGCTSQFDEEKIGKDMEGILTQLFTSVQEGDKKTFKTFFADHVVELPDFEKGCDYVFDKYKGELVDVNFLSTTSTGKHIVPGEQICYAFMTFIAVTSEGEYLACVEFYTKYESKYPNDPYKIRKFGLFAKLDNGNFEDGGVGQRYGIYYPEWLDVKKLEGNEGKLIDRLSILYNEYEQVEIIKYFYVRNGGQHIDTFCLIDIGDRLDLRSVITYNGGVSFDAKLLVEDVQILSDYSVISIVGNRKISFCVSDKRLNTSDYEEIIEYSHNNLNYWFGIKSIDCFD